MKKIILIPIMMMVMALTAIAWTPTGNIDLKNYYSLINATNVSSAGFWLTSGINCCNGINYTYFAGTGLILAGNTFSWNTTYGDARYIPWANESELNVNSSVYWDSETSQADLNVNHSDLCTALDVPYSADETFINLITKTFTFNETYGNTKWIQIGNEANLNVNSSVYWDGETSQADLNVNSSNYSILSNLSFYSNHSDYCDNSIMWDNEISQADLNVNSSNYWDNYNFASDLDYQILSGWINLSDYPVACPANTFLTQLNDSVTCTGINASNLNYNILSYWQNITDRPTNLTQFTDDIVYSAKNVNHSNSTNYVEWSGILNKYITSVDDFYINMIGTNATFNETNLNVTINGVITAIQGNLNVNSSNYWDGLNVPSDLNNMITSSGENITAGTIDFARLPNLNDTHSHNAANITSGTFGAGNYVFQDNISIYSMNVTDRICWNSGCSAYEYFNGSCIIIVGLTNTTEVC